MRTNQNVWGGGGGELCRGLIKAKPRGSWSAGEVEWEGVLVQAAWICVVIVCSRLSVCIHVCVCVCVLLSALVHSSRSIRGSTAFPSCAFHTVTTHIKLCVSVQRMETLWRGGCCWWVHSMCVWFVAYSTYHLIDTISFFCLAQNCFLLGEKQGAIEGVIEKQLRWVRRKKRPSSSRGYWDSGGSVWAGALHGGAEEGHFSTLHSAPGAGL